MGPHCLPKRLLKNFSRRESRRHLLRLALLGLIFQGLLSRVVSQYISAVLKFRNKMFY